jgi:hypothetical protein
VPRREREVQVKVEDGQQDCGRGRRRQLQAAILFERRQAKFPETRNLRNELRAPAREARNRRNGLPTADMGTRNRRNRLLEPVIRARTSRTLSPATVCGGLPRHDGRKPATWTRQNRRAVRKDAAGKMGNRRNARKVAAGEA